MSTQLHGFVIPKNKVFLVSRTVSEKFFNSDSINRYMSERTSDDAITETYIQLFDIGKSKYFARVISTSPISQLPYPRIGGDELGVPELHFDDRAEDLTESQYVLCEKIDNFINENQYFLIPIFNTRMWRNHKKLKTS